MTASNGPQWKVIPTYPNYEISSEGQVRSRITNKKLSLNTKSGRHPYQRVHLSKDGRDRYILVHRLVLEAFVGPCPSGHQCLHLDDNPRNNKVDNLKWGTPKDNCRSIERKGSANPRAKLTPELVKHIRQYSGPLKPLAEELGVSCKYLSNIRSNITWKHL